MAMTKAERAEMDALKVRCALAWPPAPPKPIDLDIARAAAGVKWVRGWWFNTAARRIGQGVTDGFCHARAPYTDEELECRNRPGGSRISMSQSAGGAWFATESDALAALHYAVADECANLLRFIERRIEAT